MFHLKLAATVLIVLAPQPQGSTYPELRAVPCSKSATPEFTSATDGSHHSVRFDERLQPLAQDLAPDQRTFVSTNGNMTS